MAGGGGLQLIQQPQPRLLLGKVPFHLVTARDTADSLAALLFKHYRRPGMDHITPKDIDLGPGGFAQLDINQDGQVDLDELRAWIKRAPDLEFTLRAGGARKGELPAELVLPKGKQPALAAAVTKEANGVLSLTVADAQLSLGRAPMQDNGSQIILAPQRAQVQQLFRILRKPDKGYIELKDLDGTTGAPGQFLKQQFPLLDRDGNGKLTKQEVDAYAQLESGAADCCATLAVEDHGRALFQLLDVNRDGRLSIRELRTAWERLAPLDKNGDGVLSPDEITRQFHLTVVRGSPNSRGFRVVVAGLGGRASPPPPKTVRGPVWFQKMDRNSIGDVSFRNFLGTRAQFNRIDADGDGLISVEEAERYDAQLLRKQRK